MSSKRHGINGDFVTFCSLFQDRVVGGGANSERVWTRKNLADCYPTDAQAEVLVKGPISTTSITEIFFETKEEAISIRNGILLFIDSKLPPFTANTKIFSDQRSHG